MTPKERILWQTLRRALIMMTKAIDKYLEIVYSKESEVIIGENDSISGIIEHHS